MDLVVVAAEPCFWVPWSRLLLIACPRSTEPSPKPKTKGWCFLFHGAHLLEPGICMV